MLDPQRLRLGDGVAHDVALGDAAELRDGVPGLLDLAVRVEGEVGRERVGDECAQAPGDDRDPLLERRQPVDQVVGDGAARELADDRDHVLVLAPGPVGRAGRDGGEVLLGDPGGEVDVVRAQVLDHADVRDPGRERALPPGDDLVDLADLPGLDPGAGLLQRGVVPLDVTDRADQPLGLERLGEPGGRRHVLGQRLLDQGVHSGLREGQPDRFVQEGRDRDHAVVDAVGDERLDVGLDRPPARDAVHVTARVSDRDEVDTRQAAEHARVVAAHHPEPDQARPQVGHQAPAPASVLTAVTMRSRSSWLSEGCTGSDRHCAAASSVSGRSTSTWNGSSRWLGTG